MLISYLTTFNMLKMHRGLELFLKIVLSYQVLVQVDGDVDAAIEFLVAEQGTEEFSEQTDSPSNKTDTSYGNGRLVFFSLSG